MIWRGGSIVRGLMTGEAQCRRAGIADRMAGDTARGQMLPGEWERGRGMVESRWDPGCGIVAGCTVLAEPLLDMVRVGGSLKSSLVTGETGIGRADIAGRMTRVAGRNNVCSGQGEAGWRVVKSRGSPAVGSVTI